MKKKPGSFRHRASSGRIKIGYSRLVRSRVEELRTGSPEALKVLCVVPAYPRDEKALHHKFQHLRLHREWFSDTQELLEEIDRLARTRDAMTRDAIQQ